MEAADVLPAGTTTRAEQPTLVRPIDRPYWDIQHWRLEGDRLTGFYRTPKGSVEGYVLFATGKRPQFYIVQPPASLQKHSHRMCFHNTGNPTKKIYSVHFYPAPETPDAGILAIEKVLGEAFAL